MPILTESYLRGLARAKFTKFSDALTERVRKSASLSHFHIFLSHSYLDKEVILGVAEHLERLGYTVYVDWREDSQLSRDNVTREAAELVRRRMGQSDCLFFATSEAAKQSKWMPWELGYMDGKTGKSAILPISAGTAGSETFKGQEYLGVYPYVTSGNNTHGKERLWVRDGADTYIVFDAWLKGNLPQKH